MDHLILKVLRIGEYHMKKKTIRRNVVHTSPHTVLELMHPSTWIIQKTGTETPRMRLFCFHNAGGTASAYYDWRKLLPSDVDLCLISLPGRGLKRQIQAIENYETILFALTNCILPYLDLPYVFFGFCGGATIALDLIKRVTLMNLPTPNHFIINAPSLPQDLKQLKFRLQKRMLAAKASEAIKLFAETGLAQTSALVDGPLQDLMGTILKADLLALFDRKAQPTFKIDMPITAIGNSDDIFEENHLRKWSMFTKSTFELLMVPGDHFQLLRSPETYVDIVKSILELKIK